MTKVRGVLGLVVLALGLWFLVSVFRAGDEPAAPAQAFTSSAQCQECHAQQYEEWSGSQHAMSWTNPRVRFLSNDFANQDCIDCHAPRPVFVTGIGERVLPRTARRHEGVDCLTCHQLPGTVDGPGDQGETGGMAATMTDPRAACRPVERVELTRPIYCAGCHNQHKTVDQWTESDWPARGEDCLACHMPYRDGDPNLGRDHRFPGTDLAMLQRAVDLRGEREDDHWVVVLENVGAGHAYPTDERSRRSDVFWRPLGDTGPWRHLHRIRDPYRHETDMVSTLLHAGETRRLPIEDPEAAGPIEVALFYKRDPYWIDPEAPDPENEAEHLVQRIELRP